MILLFQYYGHRAKLQVAERESDLERLNRTALKLAREVADKTGTLMAGNISNTAVWDPKDPKTHDQVRDIFKVSCFLLGKYDRQKPSPYTTTYTNHQTNGHKNENTAHFVECSPDIKRYKPFFYFQEQIEWAVEEGADFILGETYGWAGEAMAALECIKKYGNGKETQRSMQLNCPSDFYSTFLLSLKQQPESKSKIQNRFLPTPKNETTNVVFH